MGLILKKFSYKGLELENVYLGIDKDAFRSVPFSIDTTYDWEASVPLKVYANSRERTKWNGVPFTSINITVKITKEEWESIPIAKLIYSKIKEQLEDAKDAKEFEKVKTPVFEQPVIENGVITIKGKLGDSDDTLATVFSVVQKKKDVTLTMNVEDYKKGSIISRRQIYTYAMRSGAIDSDHVIIFDSLILPVE